MLLRAAKLGIATVIAAGSVTAGAGTAQAAPCGYYDNGVRAYLNNCGPTSYPIRIDRKQPLPDRTVCIRPGMNDLGPSKDILHIVYLGGSCG